MPTKLLVSLMGLLVLQVAIGVDIEGILKGLRSKKSSNMYQSLSLVSGNLIRSLDEQKKDKLVKALFVAAKNFPDAHSHFSPEITTLFKSEFSVDLRGEPIEAAMAWDQHRENMANVEKILWKAYQGKYKFKDIHEGLKSDRPQELATWTAVAELYFDSLPPLEQLQLISRLTDTLELEMGSTRWNGPDRVRPAMFWALHSMVKKISSADAFSLSIQGFAGAPLNNALLVMLRSTRELEIQRAGLMKLAGEVVYQPSPTLVEEIKKREKSRNRSVRKNAERAIGKLESNENAFANGILRRDFAVELLEHCPEAFVFPAPPPTKPPKS